MWSLWTVWILEELYMGTKLFIVNCSPISSSEWFHISVPSQIKQAGAVLLPHFHSHAIKFNTSIHLPLLGKYEDGQYFIIIFFLFPPLRLSKATHTAQTSCFFCTIIESISCSLSSKNYIKKIIFLASSSAVPVTAGTYFVHFCCFCFWILVNLFLHKEISQAIDKSRNV